MPKLANQWPSIQFPLPVYFPHWLQNYLSTAHIWVVTSGWSPFLATLSALLCLPFLLLFLSLQPFFMLCIPERHLLLFKTQFTCHLIWDAVLFMLFEFSRKKHSHVTIKIVSLWQTYLKGLGHYLFICSVTLNLSASTKKVYG